VAVRSGATERSCALDMSFGQPETRHKTAIR
jgi:hypothetical protein